MRELLVEFGFQFSLVPTLRFELDLAWGRGDLSYSQNTFLNNCKQASDLLSLLWLNLSQAIISTEENLLNIFPFDTASLSLFQPLPERK